MSVSCPDCRSQNQQSTSETDQGQNTPFLSMGESIFILPAVVLTVVLAVIIYRIIRPLFAVTVECWFCGGTSRIEYRHRNAFDCDHCQQYNGFNKDGDYNRPITAQYTEVLNDKPMACEKREFVGSATTLCERCNNNETLKIKNISAFVPFSEQTYDEEIAAYKHHLDTVYRLCPLCDVRVKDEILRQDQLIALRLAQLHEQGISIPAPPDGPPDHDISSTSSPSHPHKRLISLFHIISILTATAIFLLTITEHQSSLQSTLQSLFSPLLPYITLCIPLVWISRLSPYKTLFAVVGLISNLFAKFLLTKDRIYALDGVSIILNLFTLLLCHITTPGPSYPLSAPLPSYLMSYLPPISVLSVLSALNVVCSVVVVYITRIPRSTINISIRRLSLDSERQNRSSSQHELDSQNDLDPRNIQLIANTQNHQRQNPYHTNYSESSFLSSHSTKSNHAIIPTPLLPQYSPCHRPASLLSHPISPPHPHLPKRPASLRSTPILRSSPISRSTQISPNSFVSKRAVSSRSHNLREATQTLDLEMDSISLGMPSSSRSSSGIFGSKESLASYHHGNATPPKPQMPRPLIQPSKFTLPDFTVTEPIDKGGHQIRTSFSDTESKWSLATHGSCKHKPLIADVSRDPHHYRSTKHMDISDDDDITDPPCAVDSTTAPEADIPHKNGPAWWTSPGVIALVLGLSVVSNLVLVVYTVLKT